MGGRMLQEEAELVPAKLAVSKQGRYNLEFLPLSPLRAATVTFSIHITEGFFRGGAVKIPSIKSEQNADLLWGF